MKISKKNSLKGTICVPGDKSISHRAIMFGSLANGTTEITHFLNGADCFSTINCFRSMGINIEQTNDKILVHGNGLHGLKKPLQALDCGNSGTTTRLISGILAAQPFSVTLTGDESIQKRPMKRIITPLSEMGASITSMNNTGCAPLFIEGHSLNGIHYQSPVASAQVKSCILLAGLYAEGETSVTEPSLSRNHTEIMLQHFGADITSIKTTATIKPQPRLEGRRIHVPGDISSAAYFIAAAMLVPDSEILLTNVGINPTRNGILKVFSEMGADITYINENFDNGEPTADLLVRTSTLHGVTVGGDIIPTLIDEIPMIAVAAAFANGTTVIKDASELKVKESNRIDTVVNNLKSMGCNIEATNDGMIIYGGNPLHGAVIDTKKDHRIAMSFAIAALACDGETEILDADCVNISYPGFYNDIERLSK